MAGNDETLAPFLDTLLPGDDLFPAATASGMLEATLERLRRSGDLHERLIAALAGHGWSNPLLPADARRAIVATLEAGEPGLFADVRKIAYLTYYEQASVIAAIRTLGFAYNTTPLPDGYPVEVFDGDTDVPRHGRGRWIATDGVARVDLSILPHLTGSQP